MRLGRGDDRPKALDAFLDAAVDVALTEGLARGAEDDDLVGLAGELKKTGSFNPGKIAIRTRSRPTAMPATFSI